MSPPVISTVTRRKMRRILRIVGAYYGFTPAQLVCSRRHKKLAWARHVAAYLMCVRTDATLAEVGVVIGGRDHTTILHARDRVADAIIAGADAASEVGAIDAEVVEAL